MLIGRDAERQVIARLVSAARVGHSSALVLVGEAGIGKTTLLEHAVELADDMRVLQAAGSEPERDVAFAGLLQLLRPVLDGLDMIPAPQVEALAVALALREGRVGGRFAVGAATLTLLSRVAETTPLLLIIDDAHALDRSSAEALAFVGRRLMADRIGLLVASRPGVESPLLDAGLPPLLLEGLSLASVASLLALQSRGVVAPELAERLHLATAGNPLAVVELADEVEMLDRLSPQAPLPVPDAVLRAFSRRIAQLDQPCQTMLLLAAVADGDLGVVARAADDLGVQVADLARAEELQLLRLVPGRVEFRHPLMRASVYAGAALALRRRAHRAVAQALPEGDLERRAWNLCDATVGVDDQVADHIDLVGSRARDRSANAVAATAFERAALLSSSDTARARRFLAAGEAAWLAGQVPRAQSLLAQGAALTAGSPIRARIDGLRGNIALRAGSVEEARTVLLQAAEQLVEVDPDGAAMLLADTVTACYYLADAATALQVTTRLDELIDRCCTDEARIRATLTGGTAQVLAGTGGSDRIRAAVDELLALPDWTDDQRRPGWMVLGPLFLRESDTGREIVRRAVEELREHCALVTLPNLLSYTARDEASTDRWASALTGYEEGIALARESGQTTDLTMCLAGLAWLQARTGTEEACRRSAAETIQLAEHHHIHMGRAWAIFALGELELAHGRPAKALEQFEALGRLLEDTGCMDVDLMPGAEHAEALHHLGRTTEAAEVAEAYHARAVAKGQPWAMARAQRALAISDEAQSRWVHFDDALELHHASPDVYEEGRTQLAYGAALRRDRQRVAARPVLRSALATFERLGARPWADIAARELAATGERPHRRGENELDLLTPQELQIARLLGSGRTTRQAAAAMFLSPKTVEYHLRHVYTKLGISSRAELASHLDEI
ncbi:MAG: helix-turn-helix transcriptional regulator [Ornithinimicrobium sp.]|uniref:helix-turn-helix transcriptional regulator n=1 Tax=Ornithinimicrobium sp. TaxID=1977084 RepID=UPI003D9B9963